MTEKKPFEEPTITEDADLGAADRNFPLMPLISVSGGSGGDVKVSDAADAPPGDGSNPDSDV